MKISVVIPVYNERLFLAEVLAKYVIDLKQIVAGLQHFDKDLSNKKGAKSMQHEYEIIAVDDGSDDGTSEILKKASKLNRSIKVITMDGRYGKQVAVTAGMSEANGDCVILADIDVANPTGIFARVFDEFIAGNEIVYAYRESGGMRATREAISNSFTRFSCRLFGVDGHYMGRPRVMLFSRDVADILVALPKKNKFLRTMDNWVDFEIKTIEYAGALNHEEVKERVREARQELRAQDKNALIRDKVREHSATQIIARTLIFISVMLFALAVFITATTKISFLYFTLLWLITLVVPVLAMVFIAKSVLIKRVGVVG